MAERFDFSFYNSVHVPTMFDDPFDCMQGTVEDLAGDGEFVEAVVDFRLQVPHPWPDLYHARAELPGSARDVTGAPNFEVTVADVHAVEGVVFAGPHIALRAISQPAAAAGAQAFERSVSTAPRAEHFLQCRRPALVR